MSMVSPILSLPYIQANQAQKHVTHNEALRTLDTVTQLSILDTHRTFPPPSPNNADRHIVALGATGDWLGQDGKIAIFDINGWVYLSPGIGWMAWDQNTSTQVVFDGSGWILAQQTLQNVSHIGVNTTPDTTNRLSVSSSATLLTHDGNGHQVKVNKADNTDTASLLFQTNWSARAEMGTCGSDDFEIKVSPDGSNFHTSLKVDSTTGQVSFPSGVNGLSSPDFGTGPFLTPLYSAAKGQDLVVNGTGLMRNTYNMPPQFAFDGAISPNLPGSFSFSGYYSGLQEMEEFLPVDPNEIYQIKCYIRQEGLSADYSNFATQERHKQFMGLACYDVDLNPIAAHHHRRGFHNGTDSMTTLSSPLAPGDTSVFLSDSSGWNDSVSASHRRGLNIYGYQNSGGGGYQYYSRLVGFGLYDLSGVDKNTDTITLNKPFPASLGNPNDSLGVWPAGTPIANSMAGNTYKYCVMNGTILPQTDTWYQATNYMGGIDTSGKGTTSNFPPGTAYVRVFWLPNQTNRLGGLSPHPDTGNMHRVWFSGVSVTQSGLSAITDNPNGSKTLKVPKIDTATHQIKLQNARFTLKPV